MKTEWRAPEIYFDKNFNLETSSHDCGGGDACGISSRTLLQPFSESNLSGNRWKQNRSERKRLNETYTTIYGPFHPVTVLNDTAVELLDKFALPQELSNIYADGTINSHQEEIFDAIEQLVNARLLVPEDVVLNLEEMPDMLTVWLHLTDRCNLRCSYCYLPHKREDMSLDTGYVALNAAFRSALNNNFKGVKIKYAGGEPLLVFPVLRELHRHANELAQTHKLRLKEIVLSNGTLLTKDLARDIQQMGIGLMISIDGLGQIQDYQRPYAGGRGSFEDVSAAINLAIDEGLIPDLSITVTANSIHGLPDTIKWILKKNLPFKINFFRESDFSLSLEGIHTENDLIINGLFAAFDVIKQNIPRQSLLAALADRADLSQPHLRTCGVGQNYIVFNQRGQVAKCQMQMYQPVTKAMVLDPLQIIREDQNGIQNVTVDEKDECNTCEWRYWCTGGCPMQTYRSTGSYHKKSPNCKIYKAIYPQMIHLESLRVIGLEE